MSINFSKSQKAITILSLAWVIISILIANDAEYASDFLPIFFSFSLPVITYWAGVWVFGFGYLSQATKRFIKVIRTRKGMRVLKSLIIVAILVVMTAIKFEDIKDYVYITNLTSKAERGDPDAQASLGMNYRYGSQGVPQDYKLAAKWLSKAAEQGKDLAMRELYHMYVDMNDYVMAYMWMSILHPPVAEKQKGSDPSNPYNRFVDDSNNFDFDSAVTIADPQTYGWRLLKSITPEQIAEGKRLASEWVEKRPVKQ